MLIASCPILEVVDLAVLMVERLRGLAAEMEFIEPRENSQGTCPVCGESPVDCRPDWPTDRTLPIDLCGLVSCRECGTPHHGDCWTYSGGCAVFACGGQHATSST